MCGLETNLAWSGRLPDLERVLGDDPHAHDEVSVGHRGGETGERRSLPDGASWGGGGADVAARLSRQSRCSQDHAPGEWLSDRVIIPSFQDSIVLSCLGMMGWNEMERTVMCGRTGWVGRDLLGRDGVA